MQPSQGYIALHPDGVADYVWLTLAKPGENILDVGRQRYQQEDTVFSYKNCTVVEEDGKIIGMMVAFPMHVDPSNVASDTVLAPYSQLEEDNSYYICGMALFPEFRGRGIGNRLLTLAEKHARKKGLNKISLVVFEQNSGAKKLYEKIGYHEVKRQAVCPHPLIQRTGDAILMVKDIS